MKLDECNFSNLSVVTQPIIFTEPSADWKKIHDDKIIPESLFQFYCSANYFSSNKRPKFLQDSKFILFPYLKSLSFGIRNGLAEARDLQKKMCELEAVDYYYLRRLKGENYDPAAPENKRRYFKYLVVALTGTLDQFAEIVTLFLYDEIRTLNRHGKELAPGRVHFKSLIRALKDDPSGIEKVLYPAKWPYIEKLYAFLKSHYPCVGPEVGWLDLLFLYRNKLAHLGNEMFSALIMARPDKEMGTFIRKSWPWFIETAASMQNDQHQRSEEELRREVGKEVTHQDIIEYSDGLINKIFSFLDDGFNLVNSMYIAFSDYDPYEECAIALLKNTEISSFLYFTEAMGA